MKYSTKKFLFVIFLLVGCLTGVTAQQNGTCGENLTWTLDENGTLTISGTGAMDDYSNTGSWDREINQLVLEEGITHIGDHAFYHCKNLSSLSFPKSLRSIGVYSFFECVGVRGMLNLPKGLTSIGERAFGSCEFTGSLNLPESLTSIGAWAFTNCNGFTGLLTLPEGLTSIGDYAFSGCSGFTIIFNENKIPIAIAADVFSTQTLSEAKLYVPAGSETAYSQAEVWKEFAIEEYGDLPLTPVFSESREIVDCGTRIAISAKTDAEIYYGLGKDAAPTLKYTSPIVITDTTYLCAYSKEGTEYSDTVYAKYIPIHNDPFTNVEWNWSVEPKATLSLACPRCRTEVKPAVNLTEKISEGETGLKTYTATATVNEVTYKTTLTKPILDTVIITDTVYIEVGTGNAENEAMRVKLYPNPTNGSFTVEAEEDAQLQIYDAAGACIRSGRTQGGRFTGSLPSSGLYFIKLTAGNRTYTRRLIVR
ncbi:MAG: leucine-rich repeat protein [Bacteroides sp.]|nr:leucine-rich repeat protein [Bacteroides sp.]